ncbi:MAG: hypothetical protein WC637_19325 [Victivallales bacterium]
MNIIAHSLLPVVVKQLCELRHVSGLEYRNQVKGWIAIGIAGMLPDILDPHLSIGARYDSYSHTWLFVSGFVLACIITFLLAHGKWFDRVSLWCALAYLLHVAGDTASGGIDFLHAGNVIGGWWITPELWPVLDLFFLLGFILLNRKIRRQHGLNPSIIRRLLERIVYGKANDVS